MSVNNHIDYPLLERRYTEGDTGPPIYCTYTDASGSPVDITGYTITLSIQREPAAFVEPGVIVNAAAGTFKFGDPWPATAFVDGFSQKAQIQAIDSAGVKTTFPIFLINVEPRIV